MTYNRLTDNDRSLGPFDLGDRSATWRPISLTLQSGCDEYIGCSLIVRAFGWTLRTRLPQVIKPWRRWVDLSKCDWAHSPGYWDVHSREFGFSVSNGFLQVFLGPQTHDSDTTKSWSMFLPWTQWRFVRMSWYGLEGEHLRTDYETASREVRQAQWDSQHAFESVMPKAVFEFDDYDNQRIQASTHIEEREWKFGEGWFKWLSLFRKPKIRRSLDIRFSSEVGPEKGSWKGGTLGHGIDMLPGELHEEAFRRYCEQEHHSKHRNFRITYVGRSSQEAAPQAPAEGEAS